MNNSTRLVSIAGNLATGKSTLSRYLATHFDVVILPEEPSLNIFLSQFCKDPKKWAFHNFAWFLNDRCHQQEIASSFKRINWIQERSIHEDLAVFLPAYIDAGHLNPNEADVLRGIGCRLSKSSTQPLGYICLQSSTPIIVNRIKKRMAFQEDALDIKYIDSLNRHSFAWHKELIAPKIIIDTSTMDEQQMCESAASFLTELDFNKSV